MFGAYADTYIGIMRRSIYANMEFIKNLRLF